MKLCLINSVWTPPCRTISFSWQFWHCFVYLINIKSHKDTIYLSSLQWLLSCKVHTDKYSQCWPVRYRRWEPVNVSIRQPSEQLSWRGFIVIMQQVLALIRMYPSLIYIQKRCFTDCIKWQRYVIFNMKALMVFWGVGIEALKVDKERKKVYFYPKRVNIEMFNVRRKLCSVNCFFVNYF